MARRSVVVVGASLGGVRCLQALRAGGYDGDLVLVGDEPDLPYDRPALSKGVLRGDDVSVLLTEGDAAALGVTIRLGVGAEALDLDAGQVILADGSQLGFDHVVVATGSRARPSPWGRPSGVHLLRTRRDAAALGSELGRGGHLVVVGAGFIGAEVSATARSSGLDVTLVDLLPAPLSRSVGPEVGEIFTGLHRDHGVVTRFGSGVESLEGERGRLRVRLANGETLSGTSVLVGSGALPNDTWLRSSGLEVADGLVCDQFCRATVDPRVYAVGDVARWWHPRHGEHVRIEHWTNAVEQAATVAHNILAELAELELRPYAPVEYVWSDQYDWKVQLVGRTLEQPSTMLGSPAEGRFAAVYRGAAGELLGLLAVNWSKAMLAARRGIATGGDVDELLERLQVAGKARA